MTNEAKERAIRWLAEEVRLLKLAPKVNGCEPDNWAEQLEVMETCLEAVRAAEVAGKENRTPTIHDDHFRAVTKMAKLTLDQLRNMGGQVVFVDVVHSEFSRICDLKSQYGIVRPEEDCVHLFNGRSVFFASYGAWFAYAYPPAHINMEAWRGCEK